MIQLVANGLRYINTALSDCIGPFPDGFPYGIAMADYTVQPSWWDNLLFRLDNLCIMC